MPPHKSRSTSISFVEGQQNGAGHSSPLRFLLRGWLCRFILPVYLCGLPETCRSSPAPYDTLRPFRMITMNAHCSAFADGGVLPHLGQLCNVHRSLAWNAAEWPLPTSATAYYRHTADLAIFSNRTFNDWQMNI